mmetsp:Transcript_115741/g.334290  ORF Transcript_115741/g.334290 Transcript_115741/m.334290 type:complete len:90 (-) Transcript_115741:82-351(-)
MAGVALKIAVGSPVFQDRGGPLKSALGGKRKPTQETSDSRLDSRNKVIEKGGSHHVVFLDTHSPGTPVEQVREIASLRDSALGLGCIVF